MLDQRDKARFTFAGSALSQQSRGADDRRDGRSSAGQRPRSTFKLSRAATLGNYTLSRLSIVENKLSRLFKGVFFFGFNTWRR